MCAIWGSLLVLCLHYARSHSRTNGRGGGKEFGYKLALTRECKEKGNLPEMNANLKCPYSLKR